MSMRWSIAEYEAHNKKKKKPKYRNHKAESDNIKFDSMKEQARYYELKMMEKAGVVSEVKHQVKFELAPSVKFIESKRAKPALRLIVDFTYKENGVLILEDVKSDATITPTFIVKRHILLSNFGLQVRIYN